MVTKKSKPAAKSEATDADHGKHTVWMTIGKVPLPKQQAAPSFTAHDKSGKKLGTLTVSFGSVTWKAGNKAEVKVGWEGLAKIFEERKEKKTAAVAERKAKKTAAAKPEA